MYLRIQIQSSQYTRVTVYGIQPKGSYMLLERKNWTSQGPETTTTLTGWSLKSNMCVAFSHIPVHSERWMCKPFYVLFNTEADTRYHPFTLHPSMHMYTS